jgi:hypothetical protein
MPGRPLTLVSMTAEDIELHERLKAVAAQRGCFLSHLLREILTTFVDIEEQTRADVD